MSLLMDRLSPSQRKNAEAGNDRAAVRSGLKPDAKKRRATKAADITAWEHPETADAFDRLPGNPSVLSAAERERETRAIRVLLTPF
jgi:hypothetical protein